MVAPWVKASMVPRIPGTNAHAGALTPLGGLLVYFSWITFFVVVATTVGVIVLSMKGIEAGWLLRRTKARLRGHRVHSRPVFLRRRMLRMVATDEVSMGILRTD
jgi:hypothetical protein